MYKDLGKFKRIRDHTNLKIGSKIDILKKKVLFSVAVKLPSSDYFDW